MQSRMFRRLYQHLCVYAFVWNNQTFYLLPLRKPFPLYSQPRMLPSLSMCLKCASYLFSISFYSPGGLALPSWLSICGTTLFCIKQIYNFHLYMKIHSSGKHPLAISSPMDQTEHVVPLLCFSFWLLSFPAPQPTKWKGINSYPCLNQSPSVYYMPRIHVESQPLLCSDLHYALGKYVLMESCHLFLHAQYPFPTYDINFLRRQIKLSLINLRRKNGMFWMVDGDS